MSVFGFITEKNLFIFFILISGFLTVVHVSDGEFIVL